MATVERFKKLVTYCRTGKYILALGLGKRQKCVFLFVSFKKGKRKQYCNKNGEVKGGEKRKQLKKYTALLQDKQTRKTNGRISMVTGIYMKNEMESTR